MIMLYQLHLSMVKSKIEMISNYELYIIDIPRVAEIAQTIEFEHRPSLEELLNTVINRDDVEELVKRPVRFLHPKWCKFYR